jgi:ribosomal protein L35AE/L33A
MVFLQTSDAPLFPLTVTAHKIRPEYFQSRACYARQNRGQVCHQTVLRAHAGHMEASKAVKRHGPSDARAARLCFNVDTSNRRECLEV